MPNYPGCKRQAGVWRATVWFSYVCVSYEDQHDFFLMPAQTTIQMFYFVGNVHNFRFCPVFSISAASWFSDFPAPLGACLLPLVIWPGWPITAVHFTGHLLHQVSQLLRLWTWIPSRSYNVTMQSYHSKLEIMTENILNAGSLLLLYTLLFFEIAEGTLNIDEHRSVMLLQNFYTVILKYNFF